MNEIVVRCEKLCKAYPVPNSEPLTIFSDLEWEMRAGTLVAICGQSGCGKSTFMNVIGLLDRQTSGTLHIAGRDFGIERDNATLAQYRANNIGFIFQQHHLIPELTAIQNVMAAELIRGRNQNEARKNALDIMQMLFSREDMASGLPDRRPDKLSGGQCQRVAIARALVGKPALVLADEPTGNLDETSADQVLELFIKLQKELGMSVIMVTHNPQQARRANITYRIHSGKIAKLEDEGIAEREGAALHG